MRGSPSVWLALLLLSPALPARAQEADPPAEGEGGDGGGAEGGPGLEVEEVSRGPLQVAVDRAGRIESQGTEPVRLLLEEFSGALTIKEVAPLLRRGGRVTANAVLAQLDARPLERELRAAREALDAARQAQSLLEREQKLELAAAAEELERLQLAAGDAARALEHHEQVEGPALLKDAQLELQAGVNQLDDEREELSQLEAMYKATQLASETKEIVLERARRNVKLGEERLAVTRTRHAALTGYELPLQLRQLQDASRYAAAGLSRARAHEALEVERRAQGLEAAARETRDAEEHVARLEADLALVQGGLRAPADGLLEAAPELRAGDQLEARTAVSQVHVGPLVARFDAAEEDLRLLDAGIQAQVTLCALGEVSLAGTVEDVAPLPRGEEGARPVTVTLAGQHALLRWGVACRVEVAGPALRAVLSLPRRAVHQADGHTWVEVAGQDGVTRREVVLGPGNHERVSVAAGLQESEAVVVPPEGQ